MNNKTTVMESGTTMVRRAKKTNGNHLDGVQHLDDPFPKRLTAAERRQNVKLSPDERREWKKALRMIARGWEAFVKVGDELKRIRDSRLYREEYDSWEAFCRAIMGCSKTEANRQILDAEVVHDLQAPNGAGNGEKPILPGTRSHARALAALDTPEERRDIWERVVAKSPEEPITARLIEATIVAAHEDESADPQGENEGLEGAEVPSAPAEEASMDVLERLKRARKEKKWSLVDDVIRHLQAQNP